MRRFFTAMAVPIFLAACSSGGDSGGVTPPPPATPSIGVSLAASSSSVNAGSAATTTVTLTRTNFTGAVNLTATGMPTGVTASFTPAQLSGATTSASVSFDVGATAAAGTSTITVRANGTGVSEATATYSLTIAAQTITLTAGSATIAAVQGATVTVPLTLARAGGFAGAVSLTASGAPTGVTATLTPASLAAGVTSSTLSLAVASTAAAGTSTITISAAGTGVATQTATVALTITAATAPDYSLTAAPAALSVVAGQTGTSALTVARIGGFAGNVTLALEGAPAGVAGVFAPNPATAGTSTLTITTTSATAPGTYNLTVRGTATGVADRTTTIALTVTPTPSITVAVGSAALSVAAGANATNPITITRAGGFAGDVSLTLSGAPSGVTGVFTPANVAAGSTTSSLALTVGAATALGSYTLTVNATGTGVAAKTATIALTVTAAAPVANYTLSASSVSAQQGATGTSTVTITRTGGFAGAVNLAVSGLPSGVTATFNPASATGNSSSLSLAVASSVATGTYSGTITGTATGLANVTTPVSLTVTSGNSGGGGNIAFRFCGQSPVPVFFAYRNGSTGSWTAVSPSANNTFSFSLSASTGQVAYVTSTGTNSVQVNVQSYAASEFPGIATNQCGGALGNKTVTGTVAGLAAGQSATISLGNGSTTVSANGSFTITNATDGNTDLVATRSGLNFTTFSQATDKFILRRNINPAAGGSIGATLDFGSAEAVNPATTTGTVTNTAGEAVIGQVSFQTANGGFGAFFSLGAVQTSPVTLLGVPSNLTQSGDFHLTLISASGTNTVGPINSRTVTQYNRDLAARSLTLGPLLNAPTITTVGSSPYARIRVQGSWQTEYSDQVTMGFGQSNGRTWALTASRNFFGGGAAQYDLEIPDLSGVAGFSNAWGLSVGASTVSSLSAYNGYSGLTTILEGSIFRIGTRTVTITP